MKYSGIGATDIGKRRKRNEDHLLVDDRFGLYIVADGMGGYAAGDVASRLAVESAATFLYRKRDQIEKLRQAGGNQSELSSLAAGAVTHASNVVFRTSRNNRELAGMGCTLTVLLLGRTVAAMAHVGDSRLYLARRNRVRQLSTDHNLANQLVDLGMIGRRQAGRMRGGHVLTRSIGRRRSVMVEELVIDVQSGDHFVLCTDGLSNHLVQHDDLHRLLTLGRFRTSARRLVDFANASGGEDNITAIVVRVDDAAPRQSTEAMARRLITETGPHLVEGGANLSL